MKKFKMIRFNENKADYVDYKTAKQETSKILSFAKEKAKYGYCFICKTECTSFCNSHSIPKFVLKKLDSEKIWESSLGEDTFFDVKKGYNNAGTFSIICKNCDNTLFQDYENELAFSSKDNITYKEMAEIALKSALRKIYITKIGLELNQINIENKIDVKNTLYAQKNALLDYQMYYDSFCRAKQTIDNKLENRYILQYYKEVNYTFPYAFQDDIALIMDLKGKTINNIINNSKDYHIQLMNVCVFPLEEKSVILMFTDVKNTRYNRFFKQLNAMSLDEQLKIINYIIFAYSNNVYISNKLDKNIRNNIELINTAQMSNIFRANTIDILDEIKECYSFDKADKIPSLLTEKYAIK